MENTETVIITKIANGYQLTVQHDQSGSAYGCDLSEAAYEQLRLHFVSGTLPEFNSTKIIELAEANRSKCKNYKFDWRSYYNGFLDGFATYFNKHRNCR